MLRFSKLNDGQILAKPLVVCQKENLSYEEDGLEAVVFTAHDGDRHLIIFNLLPMDLVMLAVKMC